MNIICESNIPTLIKKTLVTRPKGSWKYQDAFAIATYAAAVDENGHIKWGFLDRSGKFSQPQLRRLGWDVQNARTPLNSLIADSLESWDNSPYNCD